MNDRPPRPTAPSPAQAALRSVGSPSRAAQPAGASSTPAQTPALAAVAGAAELPSAPAPEGDSTRSGGLRRLWLRLRRRRGEEHLREVLEELIEEPPSAEAHNSDISTDERVMLHNILALRDLTVADVMVPRVDIVAVQADTPLPELVEIMSREAHSRLPVYNSTLDDTIGMIHIKDMLKFWGANKKFSLSDIVRRVLFVAPTMPVLDMLLEMRRTRIHMALVVDEFGGIDGLLTIEDLVEEIVGEIDDEHDTDEVATIVVRKDGAVDAHARATLEDFEERFGPVFTEEERDNIDTLGGLVFSLAGRIPERGELIAHPSGLEFEVVDVDPRRIRRLRLRNVPQAKAPAA